MKQIEDLRFKIENLKISFVLFISSLFKQKTKSKDLRNIDFSASTQRMGLSFTDRIRGVFRRRWIKKT
ncbi:MAG: hypothetical protein LLF92_00260 [Planctomycetaceae bacterium]|nr:hypothetical protein [Planctomycetaceae bacterium]